MTKLSSIARWIIPLAALAAVAISYGYYSKHTSRLAIAASNVRSCQELAVEIKRVRQAPQRAQLATRSLEDLGSVIEKAAAEAQVGRDRVLRIDPQPARRLGKTDYMEQGTEVELLAVSLQQLVGFLYNVARADDQLKVEILRLRTPHGANDSTREELWTVDLVLAQRVYAPTTSH
jgi:hypothetical protein